MKNLCTYVLITIIDVLHVFFQEWVDQYLMTGNPKSEKARFIEGMIATFYQIRRKRWPTSFALCDPLAMAVALYPDIVKESTFQKVGVETAGTLTRG